MSNRTKIQVSTYHATGSAKSDGSERLHRKGGCPVPRRRLSRADERNAVPLSAGVGFSKQAKRVTELAQGTAKLVAEFAYSSPKAGKGWSPEVNVQDAGR